MNFLAPLFFVALAGLAIPVLIHLIQREKKQIQPFPSLMFVRQIPYKSVQRRRIHNWLLLLVRMAALALIVAAFARPFFNSSNPAAEAAQGAREVVILLDQSYSLGYGDRWERARAAAHAAVNGLGASDRGSLVLFSTGAEIVLRNSVDKAPLTAAIGAAKTGAGATRYAPALKVAGSLLAESTLPRREVVLISDFQRNGWRGEEGARLPSGTLLTPVPVSGGSGPNVSVTTVSLARSTFSNQERVAVTAAIVNRAASAANGGSVTLEVAGRPIQTQPLNIAGDGTASVTFDPFTVTARNMRGTVRIGNDALPADNAFNFIVSPAEPLRVLLVDRGTGGAALHLSRALAIGDAPRIEATTRQPETVTDADLQRSSVVVLNDVPVAAALGRRLGRFVENGGGLLIALGPRATWPSDVDVLPAELLQPIDRTRGDAGRVGAIEYGHPVFEPFRAPRSGDYAAARFYGYRAVKPAPGAQILARFDGGTPALVERQVGNGRVLLWATTLDQSWSDFPIKPVYLPFVHQNIRYLAAYAPPAPWLTVGQVLDPTAGVARGTTPAGRVALTPSGRRVPLDEEGAEVLALAEPGFYSVRGDAGDAELGVVAANVDPAESDLGAMDPKEIVAATIGAPQGVQGGGPAVALTPEAREGNQRLWWYLLVLGVVLLGADTLISNRLSKS
jgi:Aerotolerance regulator N-terminal/von Willebrand factor type A domain